MALPKVRKVRELWPKLLWGSWSCGREGEDHSPICTFKGPQGGQWILWGSKHRRPERQQWLLRPQ